MKTKTPLIKSFLLAFAILGFSATQSQAVIIDFNTVIPDSEVIIDHLSTGLDWVYAGPIAPNEFGPGNIQSPSYRAAEGWRFATVAEWAIRPDWQDFTRPGDAIPAPSGGFSDHSVYRFASEYWGDFTHVDLNDADAGRITNGNDIGDLNGVWETFYVRDTRQNRVPDTGSTVLLLAGALSALAFFRRK